MAKSIFDDLTGFLSNAKAGVSNFANTISQDYNNFTNQAAAKANTAQSNVSRLANAFSQDFARTYASPQVQRWNPIAQAKAVPQALNLFANTRFTPKGMTLNEIGQDIRRNPDNYLYGSAKTGVAPLDYTAKATGQLVKNRIIRPAIDTVRLSQAAYNAPTWQGKVGNTVGAGLSAL